MNAICLMECIPVEPHNVPNSPVRPMGMGRGRGGQAANELDDDMAKTIPCISTSLRLVRGCQEGARVRRHCGVRCRPICYLCGKSKTSRTLYSLALLKNGVARR